MVKDKPIMLITSRLQKGGALISDMRQLVAATANDPRLAESVDLARAVLTKSTAARVRDVYVRAFRPRLIRGSPPEAWRLAAVLESYTPDQSVVRPFYFWLTARAEPILYEFVTEELTGRIGAADREVRINEVSTWIHSRLKSTDKTWTPTVRLKVARGMLAALRDFGLLEGGTRKRLAAYHLAPEAFALIAFMLLSLGAEGTRLVAHQDWRLFLFSEAAVERMFLECHQRHWLRYQVAGSIHRIEFPVSTFKEYAHELLGPRD